MHPSIDEIRLETVFYALSNPDRLQIVANLYASKDVLLICANAVTGITRLPASTMSHHFRILREAGLIFSKRDGKECYNQLRLAEFEKKFPNLIPMIMQQFEAQKS